jgi:hypothetical protein
MIIKTAFDHGAPKVFHKIRHRPRRFKKNEF